MHVMHGTDYINKEEQEGDNNNEYFFYHITHHQPKAFRCLNVKGLDMKNVLLLDTTMTIKKVCNLMLLNNIHTVSPGIKVHCNTETMINSKKGYIGLIEMWVNTSGIANVVSMKSLTDKYHIRFDSGDNGGCFQVKTERVL